MGKKYSTSTKSGQYELGGDFKSSGNGFQPCYKTHPIIKLGGGTFIGGSCLSPVTSTADIYIGFDQGMRISPVRPWLGEKQSIQISYPVTDRAAPSDPEDFKKMVTWAAAQLALGKTIHAGCIGGHGRTGTFLAALYFEIKKKPETITKIREIYCEKAVESDAQVAFLVKHYGMDKAKPTDHQWAKAPAPPKLTQPYVSDAGYKSHWPKATGGAEFKSQKFKGHTDRWSPVQSKESIFGQLF